MCRRVSISSRNFCGKKPAGLPELSELDVVRHFTELSRRNFGVDTNFYPLGSCTMKYNPKVAERIAAYPGFAHLHPLLPQLRLGGMLTQGALQVIYETDMLLREITGMAAFTMQPMAGAHGELTGIMIMAAYHRDKGNKKTTVLIPDSAHGTNPASAAIAGYKVVSVPSDETGDISINELKKVLNTEVAGLMLTCPNTLGFLILASRKFAILSTVLTALSIMMAQISTASSARHGRAISVLISSMSICTRHLPHRTAAAGRVQGRSECVQSWWIICRFRLL